MTLMASDVFSVLAHAFNLIRAGMVALVLGGDHSLAFADERRVRHLVGLLLTSAVAFGIGYDLGVRGRDRVLHAMLLGHARARVTGALVCLGGAIHAPQAQVIAGLGFAPGRPT